MRFLLDMPIPPRLATWLNDQGHDAVHASALGLERAPDNELLARALAEARVVITADTDFPQMIALSGETSPGIILFRGGDYRARNWSVCLRAHSRQSQRQRFRRQYVLLSASELESGACR